MEKPDLLDTGRAVSQPAFPAQRPPVQPEPARATPSPGLGARPPLPESPVYADQPPRSFPDQPPRVFPDQPPPGWAPRAICPRCKRENTPPCDACVSCGFSFLETSTLGSPASSAAGDLVGKVLNGKYRVLSVLGEGGFGIVYRVELVLFDTANVFALKLLHPSLSQDPSFRRRFLREAGLAMSLIHENTIQIREFGQTEDGHLFFTMDYCQGEPLKAVIARDGYLNVHRALHIIRQVLLVMKLAHERGIIHRDLKPENIFLEKDHVGRDFVKVGDFGLAKSFASPEGGVAKVRPAGALADDITRGGIVGTPRYMSPEQALGRDDLDQRSDLYSVGVILCECLYGRVPAERGPAPGASPSPRSPAPAARGAGSGNLAGRTSGRSPAPAGGADPRVQAALASPAVPYPGHAVPRAIWDIVRRALEPDRESRFQSAAEFLAVIDRLPEYTPAYIDASAPVTGVSRGLGRVAAAILAAAVVVAGLFLFREHLGIGAPGGVDARVNSRGAPAGGERLSPDREAPDPAPAAGTVAAKRQESGTVPGRIAVTAASVEGSFADAAKGNGSGAAVTAAGAAPPPPVRPARLSPFPAEGVKAFLSFREGDVIRYQSYREGMVEDREVTYRITAETAPGVYEVKVTPGDRSLTWVLDEKENAWFQKFPLPDGETGELTEVTPRRWLKLPPPEAVFDGDYIQDEMRIHRDRVDVKAPTVLPARDLFAACLRVEFRQEDRVHYHYYKEGRGLVAIEVYEVREPVVPAARAGGDATTRQALSAAAVTAALAAPESAAANGHAAKVLVYARYLIAPEVRGASPAPAEAPAGKPAARDGRP